jgi:hypothetical protein
MSWPHRNTHQLDLVTGRELDEAVSGRHPGVAVLVEGFDDFGRAQEALLVDRDDFGDALRAALGNHGDGRVGDRVVGREALQYLVVGEESPRNLMKDRRMAILLARGQQHGFGQTLQRVAGRFGDARIGVRGELDEQHHEPSALDGDQSPGRHHSGGGGSAWIDKATKRLGHCVDR